MAAYGYMDHDDPAPDARTADERVAACGYPQAEWGEDIATGYATAQAVVDAWLGSPEHRANIERARVPRHRRRRRGRGRGPYWAQTFGVVVDAGSVVPAGGRRDGARDGRRARRRHSRAAAAHGSAATAQRCA